ncbi:MAG: PRC-barrel domain-containing protein, partial [Ktedonobacteraceae bacterium]|nr:PRC-barrel domain-containing protein [Ktedonobacteraceae bacterium]
TIGTIKDIIVTAGNDVYVVEASDGKQIFIPAIKEVVKQVDLIRGVMYIDPIKGMLDDEAEVVDSGELGEDTEVD